MKNIRYFIAIPLVLCFMLLAACGNNEVAAEISIDYGESKIYSQEDMDAAIQLIKEEFAAWKGCELHSVSYTADDCNEQENIRWMNDLAEGRNLELRFTQCIEFISDFHSPQNAEDQEAWELDTEYTNWQWWLARTDGGDWQLMTWGY